MTLSTESALSVPREVFDRIGSFQGLTRNVQPYLDAFFAPGVARFVPRSSGEQDPGFKQLIPYVLLCSGDQLLFYVRGKQSTETRLLAKGSIGIGGHINQGDDSLFHAPESSMRALYDAGVAREVTEEVLVDTPYRDSIVAIINDDSNDVGKVHLGIVHRWDLETPNVRKREQQITQLSFLSADAIAAQPVELENWTRICLAEIHTLLVAS